MMSIGLFVFGLLGRKLIPVAKDLFGRFMLLLIMFMPDEDSTTMPLFAFVIVFWLIVIPVEFSTVTPVMPPRKKMAEDADVKYRLPPSH